MWRLTPCSASRGTTPSNSALAAPPEVGPPPRMQAPARSILNYFGPADDVFQPKSV